MVRRLSLLLLLSLAVALSVTSIGAAVARPSGEGLPSHRPAAVLAALLAEHRGTAAPRPKPASPRVLAARHTLASVSLVNQEWVCDGPVDLASVTVRMTPAYTGGRRGGDAVHLESGCTGRIGKLTVTTSIADGVKVAQGAHDLTIGGGSIRCLAKLPRLHQDGIQAMGGDRITFRDLRVDCGRAGERLINSNLFIRQAGRSTSPPRDILCIGCYLGPAAAHTVTIRRSIHSGVEDSTICTAKFPRLTVHVGPDAVDPVTSGDSIGTC
ncbi:MAG TPA: hypothetical protein VJ814_08185 [Gaiellaceae bacterium]|nr:hypothetical protein [Gaiellaceae bacterium]